MATVVASSEAHLAACTSSTCCIISPEMNCVSAAVSRLTRPCVTLFCGATDRLTTLSRHLLQKQMQLECALDEKILARLFHPHLATEVVHLVARPSQAPHPAQTRQAVDAIGPTLAGPAEGHPSAETAMTMHRLPASGRPSREHCSLVVQ